MIVDATTVLYVVSNIFLCESWLKDATRRVSYTIRDENIKPKIAAPIDRYCRGINLSALPFGLTACFIFMEGIRMGCVRSAQRIVGGGGLSGLRRSTPPCLTRNLLDFSKKTQIVSRRIISWPKYTKKKRFSKRNRHSDYFW